MAVLERFVEQRRLGWPALVIGVALSASACIVFEQLTGGGSGRVFSHEHHLVTEELECVDCHLTYEDEDAPGWPGIDDCMVCHQDEEAEGDEPRLVAPVALFFEDGEFVLERRREPFSSEIVFSHLAHVTDEEGCRDCHAEVAASDELEHGWAMDMQGCVDCHAESEQPRSCATCHGEVREDRAPRTHDVAWRRSHGRVVRCESDLTVNDCSLCHSDASCTTCHQEEEPESHNNFWRIRGHGLSASMDRESCATCHRQDYCDRCHESTMPISHRGAWGSPRNLHCLGCHSSGANQGCAVCHSGTPSHLEAPLKPPGHNPASDCRSCHLLLPHVDGGYDCNGCHL